VIPRSVLLARRKPACTASSKLFGEAAVIFETVATAMDTSLLLFVVVVAVVL
jgi:hypothetical protein